MNTRSKSKNNISAIDIHIDVDRSQSTIKICGSLVSGLIHFINQQKDIAIKLNIPTYITIKLFSDRAKIPIGFNNNDITKIPEFTYKLFRPKGATKLIDTCFESITELSKRNSYKNNGKVLKIYTMVTDGIDNRSTKFNKEDIINILDDFQKNGNFAYFIGAEQYAIKQGLSYGFKKSNCLTFRPDNNSVYDTMKKISNRVSSLSMFKKNI